MLLSACLALAVCFGMSRYFYTPMLVLMRTQYGLSLDAIGLIATGNMIGYLFGSLLTALFTSPVMQFRIFVAGIWGTIFLTFSMGFFNDTGMLVIIRALAGVATAFTLVSSTVIVRRALAASGKETLVGWIYCGVGVGIAGSGLIVPLGARFFDAQGLWMLAALFGMLLVPFILPSVAKASRHSAVAPPSAGESFKRARRVPFRVVFVCYAVGSICLTVYGTYIVAIMERAEGLAEWANWFWIFTAIVSIPSGILAGLLAQRVGFHWALCIVYVLHATAIMLPSISTGVGLNLMSCLIFGLTFMATPVLVSGLTVSSGGNFGTLTLGGGIGQALTPFLAALVAGDGESFDVVLISTGILTLLSAGFLLWAIYFFLYREKVPPGP